MAAAPATAGAAPDLDAIAAHPMWRGLLQIPEGDTRSEVLSRDFFLSATGPGNPRAELDAALAAHAEPWPDNPQQHARCRFPARYMWLSQQLPLPGYRAREPRCINLERWAQLDRLRSVSVLLVSGYFDNPASTFGHALIRLNTDEPASVQSLLDVGVSFGALIPPDEAVPVYVVKGLLGGYQSGYSDKYFYTHDLVYTRTESRDIWDYELALTEDQRTLLALHLYELVGRKFTYYFLHRNCAYRLAEVLERVSGRRMTQQASVWFTPVELFHRLHQADAAGPGPLIKSIRYVPSAERQLRHSFAALSPAQRAATDAAIQAPPAGIAAVLDTLPPDDRSAVADTLLRHVQLRELAEQPEPSPAVRERSDTLLRLRLALPATETEPPPPPPRPSPATTPPPATLGAGVLHDASRPGAQWLLRGAAFDYPALNEHGLESGELVVLDIALAGSTGRRTTVEQLDVMRVRKIDASAVRLAGESGRSWQTVIGARRFGHLGGDRLRAQVTHATGKAVALGGAGIAYVWLEAGVLASPWAAMLSPRAGLQWRQGAWSAAVDTGPRRELGLHRSEGFAATAWVHQLALHHQAPGKGLNTRLGLSRDTRTRLSLSFSGAW